MEVDVAGERLRVAEGNQDYEATITKMCQCDWHYQLKKQIIWFQKGKSAEEMLQVVLDPSFHIRSLHGPEAQAVAVSSINYKPERSLRKPRLSSTLAQSIELLLIELESAGRALMERAGQHLQNTCQHNKAVILRREETEEQDKHSTFPQPLVLLSVSSSLTVHPITQTANHTQPPNENGNTEALRMTPR
ncbi:unnamed protein product [Leuciscus chuanchicus]